jgi:hypothetical protein
LLLGVHFQNANGSAADGGPSHDIDTLPAEVIVPFILPGMKECGDLFGLRVDAGEIGAFVQITIDARQGEVIQVIGPAVNFRDDVFDVKRSQRGIFLRQLTKLAAILCAPSNAYFRAFVHPLRFGTG